MLMRYLVHFKCGRCGWSWSVASENLTDTVAAVQKEGCPKRCGFTGNILLVGHENHEETAISQMIGQGLGGFCRF